MIQQAFESLLWCYIYALPLAVIVVLLAIRSAPIMDDQESSGDTRTRIARAEYETRRQGLRWDRLKGIETDADMDCGTDAAREGVR